MQKIRSFCHSTWKHPGLIYAYLLCFNLALAVFVTIALRLYPAGDRMILTVDSYYQYAPFLAALRDKLLHWQNLFMSFSVGLGVNFWTLIAYYALSPFNLLLLLLPADSLPFGFYLIIIVKIITAALTMCAFLRYYYIKRPLLQARKLMALAPAQKDNLLYWQNCYQKKGIKKRENFVLFFASSFYAWSGFVMAYLWNIMWLDAVFMLPLVALGLSKIFRERKLILYVLTLSYTIIVNYYTAIFVCLFIALYSVVVCIDEWQYRRNFEKMTGICQHIYKNIIVSLLDFSSLSVFSGMIAAFVLYPVWAGFHLSSAAGDHFPDACKFELSLTDIINRLMAGGNVKIRAGEPNIYVGCLALVGIALLIYHLAKKPAAILPKALLLVFIGVSFSNNILNFIWHGLHYPNQLPHRFAFVFCFLMVQTIFECTYDFQKRWSKYLLIGAVWFTVLCAGNFALLNYADAEQNLFLTANMSFSLVYLLAALLLTLSQYLVGKRHRQSELRAINLPQIKLGRSTGAGFVVTPTFYKLIPYLRQSAFILLTCALIAELLFNTVRQLSDLNENEYFPSNQAYVEDFTWKRAASRALQQQYGKQLFRMEVQDGKTINDGALYNYNGVSIFSSTSNCQTAVSMRKMGINGNNINSYKLQKPLNFWAELFGVQYLWSAGDIYKHWPEVDWDTLQLTPEERPDKDNIKLRRNPAAAGQAFVWAKDLKDFYLDDKQPYLNYNRLVKRLLPDSNITDDWHLKGENAVPALFEAVPLQLSRQQFSEITSADHSYHLTAGDNFKTKDFSAAYHSSIPVEEDKACTILTYQATEDEEDLSIYVDSDETLYFTCAINGQTKVTHEFGYPEAVQLPQLQKGDTVELQFAYKEHNGKAEITAASMNKEVRRLWQEKMAATLHFEAESSAFLQADLAELKTAPAAEKQLYLYTTIPYDSGWRLQAGGETLPAFSWLNAQKPEQKESGAFLAFALPSSLQMNEKINLYYVPPKFTAGAAVTISGIFLTIIYIYIVYRQRNGKKREE